MFLKSKTKHFPFIPNGKLTEKLIYVQEICKDLKKVLYVENCNF